MPPVASWLRALRRVTGRHRRLLAATLAGASVLSGLTALAPPPPPTVTVLAAARDLPGGESLAAGDVVAVTLPAQAVPDGALRPGDPAEGRPLAGPVRRGEPLTDVRLLGPSLLAGYGEGLVAVPVRLADADAARLLRAGDLIDVLAAETATAAAASATATVAPVQVVAAGVRVVAVPPPGDDLAAGGVLGDGALVVLATRREVAAHLARAAVTARLSATIRVT
jgi:pilus assembly protein CpaB